MDEWQKKLALLKKQREETRATPGATTGAGASTTTAPKPASPFASAASRTAPASSVASASSAVRPPATSGYTPSSATTASRTAPSVPSTAASSSTTPSPSSPSTSWRGNATTAASPSAAASSSPVTSAASPSIPTTPAPSGVTRTSLVGAPAISKPLPQAPTSASSPSSASNGTAAASSPASGAPVAGSSSGSYRVRAGSKPTPVLTPSSPSSVSPSSSGGSPLPSSPSTASAASAALASIPVSSSGGVGSSSSSGASAGGAPVSAERELSLLKTEHKMLTMKYESEIRKREGIERQLAQATQELEQLKAKRSGAGAQAMVEKTKADMERTNRKRMMELKSQRLKSQADHLSADNRASVVLSPLAKTSAGADAAATAADRRQSRLMARKSRAPPSAGAAGGAPKTNIVDIITRVLDEMMRLEGNMKKAEDGRMKAEGELLEVAMYKQASDEALQTVAADVNAQMVLLEQAISSLENFTSQNPSFTGPLNIIRDKFRNVKRAIEQRLDDNRLAGEKPTAEVVNKRASVYAAKLQLPPPPPPLEGLASASSSSSGSTYISPATRASRRGPAAALAEEKGSRTSTLLDQIRKGKNLTKIDVEAMKRDREQQLKNNRKSMALLSSLQDTLRMALSARSSEMNLYSEDDVEDWEDEGDDWEDE